MREFSQKEILSAWKTTKRSTGVYIHSPFCKEQCKFCQFKGTLIKRKGALSAYERYYSTYLPNLLKFYKGILSSDIIKHYYFGGGTPSLMSPEIMRDIFSRIPNFKNTLKTFEFHTCDWTKEKVDVLKEYNFTNVIVGVQTFDAKVLRGQGRRVPSKISISYELVKYVNSLGLNSLSDLIFFNTENLNEDLDRLSQDMQNLIDNNITEISISTLEDAETSFYTPQSDNIRFEKVVRDRVYECTQQNSSYVFHKISKSDEAVPVNPCRIYKKGTDTKKLFCYDPYLTELDSRQTQVRHGTDYNVLGIGSYKNHKHTFSKIEDHLEYIEIGDTYTPTWMLAYNKSEHSTKKLVMEFYEKLEKTIGDPPDGIIFSFLTEVYNYDKHTVRMRAERKLTPSVKWQERSIAIDRYISKLKKLFPDWKFHIKE